MSFDIRRILNPRAIAVVGASPDRDKFGGKVLDYLVRHGYAGTILPINPKYEMLEGRPCYPSLSSVPESVTIDTVLVAVPRERVINIIRECGVRGAAAVVFTSGFAETPGEGGRLQEDLLCEAGQLGVRILGPNAYGFINFIDKVTATPAIALRHGPIRAGRIGLVSHSGGASTGSIYATARDRGIDFSYIVCPGNESDIDACSLIDFLVDDPHTDVIAAVLEGVEDGERLTRVLARAREKRKPVVMLKIGRSELGRQIALSHTAHMAGSDQVFEAVVRQYDVIRVDDYDALFMLSGLLTGLTDEQRRLVGRRKGIGVISISGGIGAILGDLAGSAGLRFAELTESTISRLQALLPDFQVASNPFDVGAVALTDPSVIGKAAEILAQDPGVGIVVPAITVAENYDSILTAITQLHTEVPIVTLWAGKSFQGRGADILHEAGKPYFDTPGQLVRMVSAFVDYCGSRYTGQARLQQMRRQAPSARDLAAPGQSVLNEWQSKKWLESMGFAVVKGDVAGSAAEAVKIARGLGYPVVLKLLSADLPHKSDHDAVVLNLNSDDDIGRAYARLEDVAASLRPHVRIEGVLVETMIRPQLEVVVGFNVDEQFGPVVMIGAGGVLVELLKDVAFLLPPFDERDVAVAIKSTRMLDTLLAGFRGRPAADRQALVAFLVKLSEHAHSIAEQAREVEINPLLVGENGRGVWVADALVRLNSNGRG